MTSHIPAWAEQIGVTLGFDVSHPGTPEEEVQKDIERSKGFLGIPPFFFQFPTTGGTPTFKQSPLGQIAPGLQEFGDIFSSARGGLLEGGLILGAFQAILAMAPLMFIMLLIQLAKSVAPQRERDEDDED